MAALRGVRGIRLSVLTDETTSPERQRSSTDYAAAQEGIEFVGEAMDLGVSASKTSPFDRPELGKWLDNPDSFDAIVWWRFDRLIRNMQDMHAVSVWATTHRKMIVFAEGPGGKLVLDFRNPLDPVAQLMVTVFAFAAQMESQSIKDRVTGAQAAIRKMALRWRGGGRPPYGYKPNKMDVGWTLVPDPHAAEILRWVVTQLRARRSRYAIADELTQRGEPSPRDYWARKKGRTTGGKSGRGRREDKFAWSSQVIYSVLSSPTMLGWKTHHGAPVRDAQGAPVLATDNPLMTRAEYDEVQALLGDTKRSNGVRSDTNALLMGVLMCAGCGKHMYLSKLGDRPATYKCGFRSRRQPCSSPSAVKQEWAEAYAEETFLYAVGLLEATEMHTVPGYDPGPELEATRAEFEAHQAQEGRQRSKAGAEAWQRRADALDARMADLETRETIPARTERVGQGVTFADQWNATDTAGKRRMMHDASFTVLCAKGSSGGWRKLDDRRMTWSADPDLMAEAHELRSALDD